MPRVVVEVSGGVAEVTEEPRDVEVFVIDWDDVGCESQTEREERCRNYPEDLRKRVMESA